MLRIRRLAVLAGLVVLGLAPAATVQAAVQPSEQDTQWLQTIHQVNLAEVNEGELAKKKGKNEQVEQLGARFAKEHGDLDEKVRSAASDAGVTLPDNPTPDQQAILDRLKDLSDSEFDTQWVAAELAGHQQAIQATQTEIAQGSDPPVKELAQSTLPMLQSHFDALVALAQALGVPVPGGTTGTPSPTMTPSPTTTSPGPTMTSPGPTTTSPGPTMTSPGPTTTTPGPTTEMPAPGAS